MTMNYTANVVMRLGPMNDPYHPAMGNDRCLGGWAIGSIFPICKYCKSVYIRRH